MDIPANLYYSKEHEWVRFENGKACVGITDFAQHHLGDIVFVELPEIGTELNAMDEAGVVESVKAVSPVYSPVSGKIIDVNTELESAPERLNSAPYDN
ncbi:MAG: glycine cleavage system protein GcvH, partial [Thermoguttaceae bacterium]|nr:glycine cleavage system protein GcvH [Thermoguttaceae bacterium]